jgi:hypothetical protein
LKLPPLALTAPSLCPRCDAPAMFEDHCVQCALQIRLCGACHGVAGPYDRYCGFCGHELVLGNLRSPAWRLWLVAALVPLLAGIVFGVSPLSGPFTKAVGRVVHGGVSSTPSPGQVRELRAGTLGFSYAIPPDWTAFDYTKATSPSSVQPYVIASRLSADGMQAGAARGDLVTTKPQGAVVELGRPPIDASAVDPSDPLAVLTYQVGQLLAQPPPGTRLEVVRPVRTVNVNGRPGAEVVIKVTRDGSSYYLERVYVSATGATPLVKAEAMVPAADWEAGDDRRVQATIMSLKLG